MRKQVSAESSQTIRPSVLLGKSPILGRQQFRMVNGNVGVLPKERGPRRPKMSTSTEPAVDELRDEDWAMGVVVEVNSNVCSGDPSKQGAEVATNATRDHGPVTPASLGCDKARRRKHMLRGKRNGKLHSARPEVRENAPAIDRSLGPPSSRLK